MLGAFVKRRRLELGLSVRDIADMTGLSDGAIYMIERGERTRLQAQTLVSLAAALGVTVDLLLQEGSPQEVSA